jgi:hypothetical protein
VVEEDVRGVILDPSSLLSGAVGAFIVFVLTVLWTEIREGRQRVRARMGYARLLDTEIEANDRALEELYGRTSTTAMSWEDFTRSWLSPPSAEAWKEVRESLAPLIKAEDFGRLNEYYRLLGVLIEMMREEIAGYTDSAARDISYDLKDETAELRDMLCGYANPPRRVRWLGL